MTNTQATAPRPLTESARAYLGELWAAADLALNRRDSARTAYSHAMMMLPQGRMKPADSGEGGALNSPLSHVDGYHLTRLDNAFQQTRMEAAKVAWWYTTAAVHALAATLSGHSVTARQLEMVTLHAPGRDEELAQAVNPWSRALRPELPRGNVPGHDERMLAELEWLQDAYSAIAEMEECDHLHDEDGHDGHQASEAKAWMKASQATPQLADRLISYAHHVVEAALRLGQGR